MSSVLSAIGDVVEGGEGKEGYLTLGSLPPCHLCSKYFVPKKKKGESGERTKQERCIIF